MNAITVAHDGDIQMIDSPAGFGARVANVDSTQ
jgi:hypothetical protein